jgi:hypothetical protein
MSLHCHPSIINFGGTVCKPLENLDLIKVLMVCCCEFPFKRIKEFVNAGFFISRFEKIKNLINNTEELISAKFFH